MKNTTKPIVIFILSIAVIFCITNTSFSQQTAGQLFEKAIYMEEATGDLDKAIDLFQQILEEFPDNRELAAKSTLHLGICYEKQGLKKARGTYQDVINNYPDRQGEVALAKERLNRLLALQEVPAKPSFRKIRIPTKLSWNLALSPDGQKLLLVFDKKLWLMPLSGKLGPEFPGKPSHINTENVPVEWSGLAWSADGKWIAFNDIQPKDTLEKQNWNQSIYVVPAEGGKPKKVYENFRAARVVNYRISLSPDGKNLAFTSIDDDQSYIYSIPVEGGVPKRLADIQAREPVFSPDGKMIAFVENKLRGQFGGNLWVMPAAGGIPSLLAEAGNASSPVWSPDASWIAFLDYYDSKQIFIVPVSKDGKPAGEKIAIDAPEGGEEVRLLTGWSAGNELGALITSKQEPALYTLPEQGGQSSMVQYGGFMMQPRWSRDGKHILFMKCSGEDSIPPNHALAIVPTDGGEARNILIGSEDKIFIMPYQSGIRISPDGKKIVMGAKSHDDTVLINEYPTLQIWTTTIEGENPTQITKPTLPYSDYSPCWSPDGQKIAFIRTKLKEDRFSLYGETGIYIINSSGEKPVLLVSESDKWINSLVWSPNGELIAYLTKEKEAPNKNALMLISVDDGISRVVCELTRADVNIELAWSPDSRRIAVNDYDGDVGKIKIISLDDGSIQDIETGLVDTDIYHLDWSPDGKTFVFAGYKGGEKGFWIMENFLPQK